MQANRETFQAIAVGIKSFDKSPIFQIGTANISCDEVVKLLGVDIDFMLNFDCQIKNICKKAVQQLDILKRIGKNLSKLNRLTIFHTFVLSNFNFAPCLGIFAQKLIRRKLSFQIQERALRFVYQDYETSYENLLIKAKMPTQHIGGIRTMALETFKILNGLAPPVLSNLVQKQDHQYNFRYTNLLQIPQVKSSRQYKMTTKMIIDVDTGVDDAEAIMLALSRPEVEVVGITCVNGNVAIDDVCRNTLRVLQICDRLDIPVFKGAVKSILGEGERAGHYHGNDGLGDMSNPVDVDVSLVQKEHAVNALLRLVNDYPGELTLVALAPLTNIALALRLYPEFGRKLKEVYIMGGNIEGKGGDRLAAEFNFMADPEAAYITLQELKCRKTIISWETSKSLGVTWDWFDKWAAIDTDKGRFHKEFSRMTAERNRNIIKRQDYASCDLLAMVIAIDNSIITEFEDVWSTVEMGGIHTRGQLVSDWRKKTSNQSNVRIVTKFDIDKAKDYYMSMVI